ncbi:hypothetical protein CPB83DRAFT_908555 [Crepidotus variabilis]|uniref:Protein kinase domain-containing protein n=1 Tax=Crepidotus variabilis TaxID=179855 RepID=A0A9P6ECC3_9AGAR|nr:hypothetical protein CPB83DRAFT_908555 [Crepidotus variabilis]
MEDIPEIPPSPLQYAVKLYSLHDLDHQSTETGFQTGENATPEDLLSLERPPVPQQLSIHLYAIPDAFLSENTQNDGLRFPDAFPDPQHLSINLYPLPDVGRLTQTSGTSETIDNLAEKNPLPVSHSIDLLAITTQTSETSDNLADKDPLPVSHSVDLFATTDNLPHIQSVPEISPFPASHEIALFTAPEIQARLSPPTNPARVNPSHVFGAGQSRDEPKNVASFDTPLFQGMEAREIRIQGSSHFTVGTGNESRQPAPEPTVVRNPKEEEMEKNYADAEREIASYSNVPYVGRVADAVRIIIERCKHVEHYQKRAYVMASKCLEVVTILNSKASWLGSTDLAENSNKLFENFTNIQTFTQGWPNAKGTATLVGKEEIRLALDECREEVELALDLVQVWPKSQSGSQSQDLDEPADRVCYSIYLWLVSYRMIFRIDELRAQAYQWLARGEEGTQAEIKADRQVEIFRLPKLLNSEVECEATEPIVVGRNAVLWQGMWLGQEQVAIKVLRYVSQSGPRKRLEREISTWIDLKHKNVIPFYGTFMKSTNEVHLVRPWRDEGNILDYAKLHPGANRYSLMRDAAEGLYYLHTNSILHGNVKCANILMDEDRPKICDFGISKLAEDLAAKEEPLPSMPVRWLAPERIEGGPPSREADIYAFAMTILELVTGEHPYAEYEEAEVKEMVVEHKRPPKRPEAVDSSEVLPDGLWSLMLECWKPGAARHILIDMVSALSASSRRGEGDSYGWASHVSYPSSPRNDSPAHILYFWQVHKYEFPLLYRVAMDVLPAQASAVPCERVFSSSKETCIVRRSNIDAPLLEGLQILKFSIKNDRLNFVDNLIAKPENYTISGPLTQAAIEELKKTYDLEELEGLLRNSYV